MLPATDLADLQDHCGRPFITRWQLVSGCTAGSRSRGHCSGKFQFLTQIQVVLMIKYSTTQFLHQSSNKPVEIPASLFPSAGQSTSKHGLGFLTVPEPPPSSISIDTSLRDIPISEPRVLEDTFLVPSTRGFIVSGKVERNQNSSDSDPTWSCSMPGGIAMVEWC